MFIDEAIISVKGGDGGAGAATFFPGHKTGPSGGRGGNGGNVYIKGNKNMADLQRYAGTTKYTAEKGVPGGNFNRDGKHGEDLILQVPLGTLVIDPDNDVEFEVVESETAHLVARGGRGGHGNAHFASSTNQSPRQFEPGHEGQKKHLRLVLRLIADFGLIGLPNAGKSSLLNELTAAKVKTARYPFTTLEPNLGVFEDKVIADIPGLIEGAARGRGLGIRFLKHIEKVPHLLHCIASDSADIVADYNTITDELQQYNEALIQKPQTILLTKTDLIPEAEKNKKLKILKKINKNILPVSIFDPEQFAAFQECLRTIIPQQ